ncbi:MAG: isoquinoline 1-oxidoreductase, partial [Bacteroidetes bacterium]
NAFVLIGEDGKVRCFTGKIEMGQGIITSLAQQIADELDVTLDTVEMVLGDTRLCPYDMGTWGSLTTRDFSHSLRAAGAEARGVLLELAAEQLGTPVSGLGVKDGMIFEKSDPDKRASYASLAKGKRIERYLAVKPGVKGPSEFRYVGQSLLHSDSRMKVTGEALFTGDMRLPGMVYARVLRPPSHGAGLISVDYSAAQQMEGVQVVEDGDLVAVLHPSRDIADAAIVRVKGEFSRVETDVDQDTIFKYLLEAPKEERVVDQEGNLLTGEQLAGTIVESEFHDGYVSHAPIETHTALAQYENGGITVWASTQSPFGAQESIARTLGLDLEDVRVIAPFVGGGFGGKSPHQQAVEAARLSKITGKPVMVTWTREEEFFYDTFRPAAVVKIRSGMTRSGKMTFWDYHQYFAGNRGSDTIYAVPHRRTTGYDAERGKRVHLFNTGAWRAPGNNTNTFSRESQVDIMAARAGVDPLQFRLDNLEDERMKDVLKAAAGKFGYTPSAGPG